MGADNRFLRAMKRQEVADEVRAICQRYGAPLVIDIARAWIEANERRVAKEHDEWRRQMLSTVVKPEESV